MRTVALGDVALSLQDGPFGSNLKSSHYVDRGVRVVRLQNIGVGYFDDRDRAFVTEEHFARLRKYESRPGDVLIATLGDPIVRACRQPPSVETALHKADCLRLRCDPERIAPEYLVQFLNSDILQAQAKGLAHGQTRPRVNLSQVRSVMIPLPSLEEQRRLADILDQADALRTKRRAALAHLDALTQSIFVEMFGDVSEWPSKELLTVVTEFRYGTSVKSQEHGRPALRIPNVVGGTIDFRNLKLVPVTPAEFERLQLTAGDLLFVRTNGNPKYVGRCAVFDPAAVASSGFQPDEFVFASYLIRARLDVAAMSPIYLREFLLGHNGRRALRSRCKTSAGQFNINIEGLGSIPIPQPPLSLQQSFAKRVGHVELASIRPRQSLTQLDSLFASLQHRAFRGEL